jgi:hypothetical protein
MASKSRHGRAIHFACGSVAATHVKQAKHVLGFTPPSPLLLRPTNYVHLTSAARSGINKVVPDRINGRQKETGARNPA